MNGHRLMMSWNQSGDLGQVGEDDAVKIRGGGRGGDGDGSGAGGEGIREEKQDFHNRSGRPAALPPCQASVIKWELSAGDSPMKLFIHSSELKSPNEGD
ncbi:hypothetical protein COCNU_08G001150 [Cocos nucifera]|uniref:Uncharacterized protein n=1 Tax=Cocos nucifera TaxID=13894 RepID=A0A8K0IGR6_COCNU|nr:hypothetical protein COCNU_08G001150 [Cocos nucifera]